MSDQRCTIDQLAEYPKTVLLEAIRRGILVMPTVRQMEYARWEAMTQEGLRDMQTATDALKSLGPMDVSGSPADMVAHTREWNKLQAAFDRAQDKVNDATERWDQWEAENPR